MISDKLLDAILARLRLYLKSWILALKLSMWLRSLKRSLKLSWVIEPSKHSRNPYIYMMSKKKLSFLSKGQSTFWEPDKNAFEEAYPLNVLSILRIGAL